MTADAPPAAPFSKAPTGIEGFDQLTGGGIPRGRITVVLGGAGAGKTVFSLQSLVNAAATGGEPGIFVAFEEDSRRIRENADGFGWDLPALERERLLFVDAYVSPTHVVAGDFDLGGVLAQVAGHAEEIGARWVVFDGIDVLLALLAERGAARRELHRLFDWLAERELTAVVTAKAEGPDPLASPQYGALPFMADCVVVLQHQMRERVSTRGVRVVKYRGSSFAENEFPVIIASDGMEVATYGGAELRHPVFSDRRSTGVERLDAMLAGGYHRGSSVLVTGVPGVAKTTLAASFADAACRAGERVLYLSFDEPAAQIVRNLASVGLDLGAWQRAGLLDIWSLRSEARGVEEHLAAVKRRVQSFRPAALVVDPLSALAKAGGTIAAVDAGLRLLDFARSEGLTVLCTSLQDGSDPLAEESALQISTIADTWLHLSYNVRGGERNRALTVVKSRGTPHSNQVREMILSSSGVTLADVYSAGGEVLMGTARWEREHSERLRTEREAREAAARSAALEHAEAELRARLLGVEAELRRVQAERSVARAEEECLLQERAGAAEAIHRLRRGDPAIG